MTEPTEFPCRMCGAKLTYQAGVGALACAFCGTINEPEGDGDGNADGPWGRAKITPIAELDYHAALRDRLGPDAIEETATIACPGCGAEVTLDTDTLAEECPFCATPLARSDSHAHRHPKPGAVLPFALTEREGRARMKDWLGGLWFAPGDLKKFAEAGRPLRGVYLPYYTYDANGRADYRGQRGDAYYVTRTRTVVRDGKSVTESYQERRVRWSPRSGSVRRVFDDVLVPASDTMTPSGGRVEDGDRSWDLAGLEPYRADFLAGFRAEAPGIGIEDGFGRAERLMEQMLRRDVRFDIGGDEQRIDSMRTGYGDITFKHVLLPVWLASYRWRNKPYRVVINGRTGAVTGDRPYSALKIAIAVVLGIAVAAAIGYGLAVTR